MHLKTDISFKAAFTVTLQLVAANYHLLGGALECDIRKSVRLSWHLSGFLMLPIHNMASYHPLQSQPPCLLAFMPALSRRGRQSLILEKWKQSQEFKIRV